MIKFFEIIKISLLSIYSNKVRSFLTMLGIIIGVFAVVILIAAVAGVKNAVTKEISALGVKSYAILPGETSEGASPSLMAIAGVSTLKTDDAEKLRDEADKSQKVTPLAFQSGKVSFKNRNATPAIIGTWQDFLDLRQLELDKGRNFNKKDIDGKKKVVVLSEQVTEDLLSDRNPIGQKITINNNEFEVVGTTKKISTIDIGINFNNMVYLPLSTIQDVLDTDQISRIMAEAKPGKTVPAAVDQAKEVLLEDRDSEDFSIFTQEQILDVFKSTTDLLTLLLSSVAAISLLIGGIGIMNIMLVSVVERTREIGLRKAVGATNLDILIQFLTEAVILSTMGSMLGLALARVVAYVVSVRTPITPSIDYYVLYLAIGFGVGVGVVFGVAPAIRASQQDPIHALHHE